MRHRGVSRGRVTARTSALLRRFLRSRRTGARTNRIVYTANLNGRPAEWVEVDRSGYGWLLRHGRVVCRFVASADQARKIRSRDGHLNITAGMIADAADRDSPF